MTITTTINFSPVDFHTVGGLAGTVHTVHWQCIATSGEGEAAVSERIIGTERLGDPNPDNFEVAISNDDDEPGAQAQRAGWVGADRVAEIKAQAEAALTAKLAQIEAAAGTMA
jgi:hypothetical protein